MIRHTFRGQRWRLVGLQGAPRDRLAGCNHRRRILQIPIDGDTRHELDAIIHEAIHACLPDTSESAVNSSATDIARLLWRLGWRRQD
jgi:hypothetical protein